MFTLTRQDTAVMKGIAICAMLCHHLYGCLPDGVEPYSEFLYWLGGLGKVCVALFLFCSGYGLSASYTPTSIIDELKFIGRRLTKFYMNYWVIFIIFVPISIFVFHRTLSVTYGENANVIKCLVLDVFGLQGDNSYNVTWWFNELIIYLYLLFPIIYRMVRLQPVIAIIASMVMMRLSAHIPFNSGDIFTWLLPFVLGIVWKLYEEKLSGLNVWLAEHKVIFALVSMALLSAMIMLRTMPIIPHWSGERMDGFLTCAITLVVLSVFHYMPYSSTVFAFLGKHSMNIYMTHTFFLSYWHPEWLSACGWMRGGGNFIVLMMICLIVSIGIEYLKEKIRMYELVQKV